MEFYGFIHFTVNTFTNREWGDGDEDPLIFNPTEFDADQWVKTCKRAGMKGIILTCKHHDGFCLWPSRYTEHSVKNSPWKDGKGDIVKEVSDACRKENMKFGVYLSPWDRHEKSYGDSDRYNEYYRNQLTELLSNYGDIFEVWLDGACGEGKNGKKQVYAWDEYYDVVRRLQPNAVIAVCGPDVRWCGNEAGHCRRSEWSVVPKNLLNVEKIQDKSQKFDDGKFSKVVNSSDEDLGSREAIKDAEDLVWYPSEVNTSIRPGWFYHPSEDDKLKSVDELLNIYYGSVGGNAAFLLNIPPDKRGLIHEADVQVLEGFGSALRRIFKNDLLKSSAISVSSRLNVKQDGMNLLDDSLDTCWSPQKFDENPTIIIGFSEPRNIDRVVLMEYIKLGQKVEGFSIEYNDNGKWIEFFNGTTVGYKKICCFERINVKTVRVIIKKSRGTPSIARLAAYNSGV
ncbi:alpha-L-fucosidase [Clostridium oryzae]|uniref:alpha-L-fucosidase n=1 Tax=Clostridium oryzae TaxID=1450648 RepID=A0A1V4IXF1_9CLOT|nr:alpha-L-fucosidase [Clostridium oryzae]OPJ64589.1 alpha-L-fucosidase [Clostridium oryzae]